MSTGLLTTAGARSANVLPMTSPKGSEQRRPEGRWLSWDRSRPLDHRPLAVQFFVCVTSWVAVVELLTHHVSGPGLLASVVTAFILVVVSWALAKCGLPRTADQAAPTRPEPGEGGGPAPSGAGLLA